MTNNLDKELLEINSLKWLPWVGDNYLSVQSSNKLLVIGESHYYKLDEKGSFEKHQDNGYTRVAIQKIAVEREYKTYKNRAAKIFPNFHLTIFGNDKFESKLLWENVCYYNFIQDPMNTNYGRPKKSDYAKGWKTFADVVNVLKPSICIFLGNSSTKYFPSSFDNVITISNGLSDDGWVNNTASRKATIRLNNEQEVILKFIRHPSNHYSWTEWNSHLKGKQGDLINWLSSLTSK